MAANDPGLATFAASAEDPMKGAEIETKTETGVLSEDQPTAPDQFDPKYETTRREIWAYYSYYIGNNGLSLFNFAPTAAQNLLALHAAAIGGSDNSIVNFAGADRSINAVILLCNGISFAIQAVLFLVLGAYADFGTFRPNILIGLSLVAWGIGFGWLGVHEEPLWQYGLGLYIVGLIAYQLCLTYWTAAFPGLARNTPHLRQMAEKLETGECTREQYDHEDSMKRNELSNVAFYVQSVAEVFILAIIIGIMFGVNVNASVEANNYGLSVLIAFASGVWILVAIPWFVMEKRRPGQDPGMNIAVAGFWQLYRAMTQIWQLRQSLFYLIGYFLLGDCLNTTVTVIGTLQNSVVLYNTLQVTYLLIVGIAAQGAGIWAFWTIQKRYQLATKTMFNAVAVGIVLLNGWGMIGNWTDNFGFKNVWELWVYQTFYGLFVCPWYSYSQIMISEVTPRGKEFLFFSLFSIIGKTSSFIGPFVTSAIIVDADNNNSAAFYFLFALSLVSFLFMLFFVDVKKSQAEQAEFLEREKVAKLKLGGSSGSADLA